jgi:hypothetical protein
MKIKNLLLAQTVPMKHKNALMKQAHAPLPTTKHMLMKQIGVPKRLPTQFYNKQGRQFFLTLRGTYVLRVNGKSLYGRKSISPNAPKAIRPRK